MASSKPQEFKHLPPRISHLDSLYLDSQISELLKSTLLESVKLSGVTIFTKFEPEIDAVLKYLLLRFTLLKHRATFGQQLLQIKYSNSVPVSCLQVYATMSVLIPWLNKRFSDILHLFKFQDDSRVVAESYLNKVEVAYKVVSFANLLVFLHQGCYSSVEERILKLKPVATAPPHQRSISFEYFNRELLWTGIAELIGSVISLVPLQSFHNVIQSILPRNIQETTNGKTIDSPSTISTETVCAVCSKLPILPHRLGCAHIACYYCIHLKFTQTKNVLCPLCSNEVDHTNLVPVCNNNAAT